MNYTTGVPIMHESNRRLREARETKYPGCSASEIARMHGWTTKSGNVSTYISHETGPSPVPREDAETKYGPVYGVNFKWILNLPGEPKFLDERIRPDAERIKLDQLAPGDAKIIEAAMAGMNSGEVWRITSDMMVGAPCPYAPGDIVIIDRAARPKPQSYVLAEISRTPILRMYSTMSLWSFHMSGRNPPIPLVNVQIRGVVLPHFKLSA